MLNKLLAFLREYKMLVPGDHVVCAVSGGADSMALLWSMYLLKDQLGITLSAAHFNHHLRGDESNRDSRFVDEFCKGYGIPCVIGDGNVTAGAKGLEAAAREARYAFLNSLEGKVATAHTADDNAETLLMHLVRGTGLKGLGGISPVREKLIRPMLSVTRQEVERFLAEYSIPHVQDSSNDTDEFLRNRIRHSVMPLLKKENPSLAENLSATALRLRQDEQALDKQSGITCDVAALRAMEPGVRTRVLTKLLKGWGVKEPEAEHIFLLQRLVDTEKPSASASFPNGIVIAREYRSLVKQETVQPLKTYVLNNPGVTEIPELGLNVVCTPYEDQTEGFCVRTAGSLILRQRQPGDEMRLPGGTKELKKLFIDRKIPASQRCRVPVLADDCGVVGVLGIGPNRDRIENPTVCIRWEENKT